MALHLEEKDQETPQVEEEVTFQIYQLKLFKNSSWQILQTIELLFLQLELRITKNLLIQSIRSLHLLNSEILNLKGKQVSMLEVKSETSLIQILPMLLLPLKDLLIKMHIHFLLQVKFLDVNKYEIQIQETLILREEIFQIRMSL